GVRLSRDRVWRIARTRLVLATNRVIGPVARSPQLVARVERIRARGDPNETWRSVDGKLDHGCALRCAATPPPAAVRDSVGAHARVGHRRHGRGLPHRAPPPPPTSP